VLFFWLESYFGLGGFEEVAVCEAGRFKFVYVSPFVLMLSMSIAELLSSKIGLGGGGGFPLTVQFVRLNFHSNFL